MFNLGGQNKHGCIYSKKRLFKNLISYVNLKIWENKSITHQKEQRILFYIKASVRGGIQVQLVYNTNR